ncbi:MAG TPA: hypothetical protein VEP90_17495, partial [Methylomirabilota bacterium]|nr:hypothetical protein [Methylomirabilota bacterium]
LIFSFHVATSNFSIYPGSNINPKIANPTKTVKTNHDKKSTKQTKQELYHILSSLIIVSGCN